MKPPHFLKCVPPFFGQVWDEEKTAELRENDRGYETGDAIVLLEWCAGAYTGRELHLVVSCVTDYPFCLKPGCVMLSFHILGSVEAGETPFFPGLRRSLEALPQNSGITTYGAREPDTIEDYSEENE